MPTVEETKLVKYPCADKSKQCESTDGEILCPNKCREYGQHCLHCLCLMCNKGRCGANCLPLGIFVHEYMDA